MNNNNNKQAILAAAFLALTATAGFAADDDLSVVKHAVGSGSSSAVRNRQGPLGGPSQAVPPRWFKVRVLDKSSGKTRVTLNVPLRLVRAMGEGWPDVRWRCAGGAHGRCSLKVAEVLAALDRGQELIEVDDDRQRVKVWVE